MGGVCNRDGSHRCQRPLIPDVKSLHQGNACEPRETCNTVNITLHYPLPKYTVQLHINGQSRTANADPSTPLLWVLRDELNLTGTKFGCGIAACGACTVHVDGQPVRSCVMPVSAVANQKIRTIESLGSPENPHPLQAAWIAEQVPQCGYCQSGMLMAAAALLDKNPKPSDAEIDAAMTNLCRCGTYQRVRAAIHRAAATQKGGAA